MVALIGLIGIEWNVHYTAHSPAVPPVLVLDVGAERLGGPLPRRGSSILQSGFFSGNNNGDCISYNLC